MPLDLGATAVVTDEGRLPSDSHRKKWTGLRLGNGVQVNQPLCDRRLRGLARSGREVTQDPAVEVIDSRWACHLRCESLGGSDLAPPERLSCL